VSIARESTPAVGSVNTTVDEPVVVRLELPASSCCRAVGRLVVGGVGSRLAIPVEQIEDLQLAVEALLARRPAQPVVNVELTQSRQGLRVRLGPLAPAPAERERVHEMLCTLVDDADVQDSDDGEWIVLSATRPQPPARGSA
jgi:hypothetical protein